MLGWASVGEIAQMKTLTHRVNAVLKPLFADAGTEVRISPLLDGIRSLSGEKIQWYLASELRDRIRVSGAAIRVIDRTARAEFKVEPRQFEGRLLHEVEAALSATSACGAGDVSTGEAAAAAGDGEVDACGAAGCAGETA